MEEGFFTEEVDQDKLKMLVELGCDEEKSKLAMMITGNSVDSAATLAMELDLERLLEMVQDAREGGPGDDDEGEGAGIAQVDPNDLMAAFEHSLQCKMIIIVRKDLGMSTGKIAAQVGHAVLGLYKEASVEYPEKVAQWEMLSWPKIVLEAESEAQMDELRAKAEEANICHFQVQDAGRTEVEPNTKTVLALGPDLNSNIDPITGSLKLLK
ncbi:unnamed protein product [Moneuplotes crassus]|uniref:peptidyl-tRNA hydrolase n=1 Tax=Euplotes crassus TaxID=5936 RepID=A0AAD2D5H2_EUPCR|nr:unnamed protein product [Moneuplotes crassus]